jgi:hypothetical protein
MESVLLIFFHLCLFVYLVFTFSLFVLSFLLIVGGSPGTPTFSTTKTGCHDVADILLKVALSTKNQNHTREYFRLRVL